MTNNKTFSPKAADISHDWWVVDAADMPLGRLASEVAQIIRGKHKPTFAPHVDGGDFVIVVNADKVQVTSDKSREKIYYRHSGFPGGLKAESFEALRNRRPEAIIERAVGACCPRTSSARRWARRSRPTPVPTTLMRPSSPRSWSSISERWKANDEAPHAGDRSPQGIGCPGPSSRRRRSDDPQRSSSRAVLPDHGHTPSGARAAADHPDPGPL
jgi:large subunit ribosomal protein L13